MCPSIILVSCFTALVQECCCILGGNSLSMTFPNQSGCWFVLMNCHRAYCFPTAVQLDRFTGAPKMRMMLVWGFSLIEKALLRQIVRKLFMQDIHPHPVDTPLLHFPTPRPLLVLRASVFLTEKYRKRLSFLLRIFL